MKEIEVVIGLEVHVQLATATKMFCRCPNLFGQPPNTLICPVCMGLPGSLPVVNAKAVELGIKAALALNCHINREIIFERKNYFYPDLPKGYQISQYALPLAEEGFIEIEGKKIRIRRAHLEEDAGKLIHSSLGSGVDFNRAGVPLLEIVTEPDIHSPQQAYDYLTQLKTIMQYVGVSSCDMEKGFLRCDANISLPRKGEKLGVKTEVKNMNSFRGVKDALSYEIERQSEIIQNGGRIIQETRLWDEARRKTFSMRSKEEAHDYRYFPEPDLVKYTFTEEEIEKLKDSLPEMPQVKYERFKKQYKIEESLLKALVEEKNLADFFESSLRYYPQPKSVANWILGPLREIMNIKRIENIENIALSPDNFTKVVRMFDEKKLNNIAAKKLLSLILENNENAAVVAEKNNLLQISNAADLEAWVEEAVRTNPKPVNDYLSGKKNALMFLVGVVMRKSSGQANPTVVKDLLVRRIKDEKSN